MAMNAIRLLTQQHRDMDKWFQELARLHGGPELAAGWPHEGQIERATTDSGEEIRSSARLGTHLAGPEAVRPAGGTTITAESELARTATPLPSEADGRTDNAVPGQGFRDLAGHFADGKTHVGMDLDRVRAQMFEADSARLRPDGMIGQGRENLAGVRDQLGAQPASSTQSPPVEIDRTTHHEFAVLSEHELDHKRALTARLFDALVAHTVMEEQLLYPAARHVAAELVAGALEAHREIKQVVSELRHTDATSARFDQLLRRLHRTVTDHEREEEDLLLPRMELALGAAKMEEVGAHMQERSRALLGLERRFSVRGAEGVAVMAAPGVPPGHLEEVDATFGHDDEPGRNRS